MNWIIPILVLSWIIYLRQIDIQEIIVLDAGVEQQVNTSGPVLDQYGAIAVRGLARRSIRQLDSSLINPIDRLYRFKKWNYYHINTDDAYLAIAFVDLGYVSSIQFTFYSIKEDRFIHKDALMIPFINKPFPLTDDCNLTKNEFLQYNGSLNVTVNGYRNHNTEIRDISIAFDTFKAEFKLEAEEQDDIFTLKSFNEDGSKFFYSRKAYNWKASGFIQSEQIYKFNANGGMDWGRGIFPYSTFWLWISGQGFSNGKIIGFNLGAGNSGGQADTSDEVLFIDHQFIKLQNIKYTFDLKDLTKSITAKSDNFELTFTPKSTHLTSNDFLLVNVNFRQLIGVFSGKYVNGSQVIGFEGIVGICELNRAKW